MKKTIVVISAVAFLVAASIGSYLLGTQSGPQIGSQNAPEGKAPTKTEKKRKVAYWVAPMDPNYRRDKPGKSPMGMDLVPVYEDQAQHGAGVKIDPVTQQNMGIRTAKVIRGPLVRQIRTVGNIAYDEARLGSVTLKIGGYIETLYVDKTGEEVKKGDPLFKLYSPALVQAQDEYLRTLDNTGRATGDEKVRWDRLLVQARNKLLRWDVTQKQIQELAERGHSTRVMTFESPFEGVVTMKHVIEGTYVKPGEMLFQIADLKKVWVYVSVFEFEFPWVRAGETAEMTLPYFPGKTMTGRVDYVYPYLDPKTRDRKVRLVFPNPGQKLVPDMYATVHIDATLAGSAVLAPDEAVMNTGTRQVAFLAKGNGTFEPRNVVAGVEAKGGYRQILEGLSPGDEVVTSGQFLIDSESRLQEAIEKMKEKGGASGSAASSNPRGSMKMGTSRTPKARAKFTAPPGLTAIVAKKCVVKGGTPDPNVFVDIDGYRIFFCCAGCPPKFRAEPEKYVEKLNEQGFHIRLRTAHKAPSGR